MGDLLFVTFIVIMIIDVTGFFLNQAGVLDWNFGNKSDQKDEAYSRCANCRLMKKIMESDSCYFLDCQEFGKIEIPLCCNSYKPMNGHNSESISDDK